MTSGQATGVVRRRKPAEELPIGEPIDCGSYAIDEQEMMDFARQWDPQYFHIDPEAAAGSAFGRIIASGIYTTAIYQRLVVHGAFADYDVIAGRHIRECRFVNPVYAGDELHATVVVSSVSAPVRGRCDVVTLGTLRNQDGATVLELELTAVVRSADGGTP